MNLYIFWFLLFASSSYADVKTLSTTPAVNATHNSTTTTTTQKPVSLPFRMHYVVTSDCMLYTGDSIDALEDDTIPCESITSAYYQTSKAAYIIFIKYESEKEISLAVLSVATLHAKDHFDLQPHFKKLNYDYILGNCSFDKTLLSAGVDSDILYIVVSCGETWAFMRTVLNPDAAEIWTPSGPLIYFKKGDKLHDRLLFVPLHSNDYEEMFFDDSVVLRYKVHENTFLTFCGTYLHQLNNTEENTSSVSKHGVMKFFAASTRDVLKFIPLEKNGSTFQFFRRLSSASDFFIDLFNSSPNVKYNVAIRFDDVSHVGFAPTFVDVESPAKAWNFLDVSRSQFYEADECLIDATSQAPDCNENHTLLTMLYGIAGAELLILIATIIAFVVCVIMKRKKKSNVVTKRENPAVTQILTNTTTKID